MNSFPFYINILINLAKFIKAFINNGCLCYAAFNEFIVRALKLLRIFIFYKSLKLAKEDMKKRKISFITYANVDIDKYKKRIFGYVIKKLAFFFILKNPWLKYNNVIYKARKKQFRIGSKKHGLIIKKSGWLNRQKDKDARLVNARMFAALIRRNEQDYRKKTEEIRKIFRALKKEYTQVIAIFMKNINKALFKLDRRDPVSNSEKVRKKLPKELKGLKRCFDDDEGTAIPPHRPGRDHAIPLEKDEQGRERNVPWGPLYGISREELLVLKKTLTDLLNKGWIQASSLIAGAPVLFVKKPEGGLRFCVNYRALNAIISQNRYPLPLIRKILKGLAKARYYTKMNVRAAFYRFRIKKENEWKIAFRTRFELFKWVIIPFGLAEALAIF
jgi:hypothetical protein